MVGCLVWELSGVLAPSADAGAEAWKPYALRAGFCGKRLRVEIESLIESIRTGDGGVGAFGVAGDFTPVTSVGVVVCVEVGDLALDRFV